MIYKIYGDPPISFLVLIELLKMFEEQPVLIEAESVMRGYTTSVLFEIRLVSH